jgi:hypothetical protein
MNAYSLLRQLRGLVPQVPVTYIEEELGEER